MIAPMDTPALSGMVAAEPPPQDAGDVPYDAAWGGSAKAHTNDPTPVSAEGNSLGKKGAIGDGESFEEYMKMCAAVPTSCGQPASAYRVFLPFLELLGK